MDKLEKYQYLGLMRSGTRQTLVSNTTTVKATAVKQATVVVHGLTHTSTYMESHITHIKHIDAVLGIYPEENILKAHTHQQHGNDSRTRVGDGSTPTQSVAVIAAP